MSSILSAVSATISHWVEAGSGISRFSCSPCRRWKGNPLPYFSSAIMLAAVASYFSVPTPAGASAVYTSPHRLQRSFASSYTVAVKGACPTTRISTAGVVKP